MSKIYHERQSKELCALHALNNLFQSGNAFSQKELDSICYSLSPENWINPHKSVLGFGNYDVNVVTAALNRRQYELVWFDRRKDPEIINFENVFGFILNLPSDYRVGFINFGPLFRRKHWIALRSLPDPNATGNSPPTAYFNLDSKLRLPERIGSEEEFVEYLRSELQSQDKQLFLIVETTVAEQQRWRRDST